MSLERYAIYFAPEQGSPLAEFGRTWLGDGAGNEGAIDTALPAGFPVPPELHRRAIATPARYGLHATMKAPFRLSDGVSERALVEMLEAFCARHAPCETAPLRTTRLGSFLALLPSGDDTPLARLARHCVVDFETLRAPMTGAERERRRPDKLTPRERALLGEWGYPYVLDRFRFHVTLTGELPEADLARIESALAPLLVDVTRAPFQVRSLCLFGDPGSGQRFILLHRFPLLG